MPICLIVVFSLRVIQIGAWMSRKEKDFLVFVFLHLSFSHSCKFTPTRFSFSLPLYAFFSSSFSSYSIFSMSSFSSSS